MKDGGGDIGAWVNNFRCKFYRRIWKKSSLQQFICNFAFFSEVVYKFASFRLGWKFLNSVHTRTFVVE